MKKYLFKRTLIEYLQIFRNYKKLNLNEDNDITKLLYDITNLKITNENSFLLEKLGIPFLEIAHRQYLLETLFANRIIPWRKEFVKNYKSSSGLTLPLMKQYFQIFNKHGYKVNFINSSLLLYKFVFIEFFKALNLFIKVLINFKSRDEKKKKTAEFCDLPSEYKSQSAKEKYNLYSWFVKNYANQGYEDIFVNQKIKKFYIDEKTKVCYRKNIFRNLNLKKKIYFFLYSLLIFLYCFVKLFNFKELYKALMIKEYLLFKVFDLQDKSNISEIYLFSQAAYVYKPLWTYSVEKKGSKIEMYYYACSFDGYFFKNKYPLPEIGTTSMNWPKIIMWSKSFKLHYEKIVKNSKFILSAPVFYKDDKLDLEIKSPSLGVFDITPYRPSFRASIYGNENYRNYQNTKLFIEDLVNLSKKFKVNIYFKSSKILTHPLVDKRYKNLINSLNSQQNFYVVKPSVSPFQLIEKTNYSISFPWTSPGCIPEFFNKIGYYYDCSKTLCHNDRALQNSVLLSGYDELKNFFLKNFN